MTRLPGTLFQPQPEAMQWQLAEGFEPCFEGDVATDGSMVGGWRDLGRTGLAAVQLGAAQDVAVLVWGPLPVALPVQRRIARAELFAVLVVLRSCLPPIRLHVDCALILRGIQAGERWCTHSGRPHADVWRMIWARLADIGLGQDGASFFKVKAHQSKARIAEASDDDQHLLVANSAADTWAKEGAKVGVNELLEFVDQAVTEAAEQVEGALTHIAGLADALLRGQGSWGDAAPPPKREPRNRQPLSEVPVAQRHTMVRTVYGAQCSRCYRRAYSDEGRTRLETSACAGHVVTRLVLDDLGQFASVHGHRLWCTGPYVWCSRCGCHASQRVQKLTDPCNGGLPAKGNGTWSRRSNLAAGRAPKAKVTAAPVGTPRRLTVEQWLQWRGLRLEGIWDEAAPAELQAMLDKDMLRPDGNATLEEQEHDLGLGSLQGSPRSGEGGSEG